MFLTFDTPHWFNDTLRDFFGAIDHLIYSLVGWIVQGIFNLANLNANAALTQTIYKRIYIILGVYMIFKLSFSFLKYLLNPDAMSDKEQGVGKLIVRVVTMIAMLVALPIIFFEPLVEGRSEPILNILQNGVLKTLPRIILGVTTDSTDSGGAPTQIQQEAGSYGEYMAKMMLRSFYYPTKCNSSEEEASTCDTISDEGIDDLRHFKLSLKSTSGSTYDFHYMWPLSTITGILMVIILLGLAIDIAIRCFKLIILQMIAPVPVMSYIDPKSSKDGAFNSWLRKYISTYIDIFIKLGTLYLLLVLISKLFSSNNSLFGDGITKIDGVMSRNFVRVFLVVGLFKFVKDAPKFIKDVLGIKDNGTGGSFMGKAFGAMAGAAAGFAGGLMTGGLAGGMSGIMSGASAGAAGNAGKAFSQVRDEQAKLLGKTPGGLKGKLQNKAMQRSVMKHTGLNKNTLKDAKDDMIAKQNYANELAARFQRGDPSVEYKDVTAAQAIAAKAQSEYESANSLAKQIGLKPGFMEEKRRHGRAYVATARMRSATKEEAGNVASAVRSATVGKVSDFATDVKNHVVDSYDAARYQKDLAHGGAAYADDREEARLARRTAKEEYKDSLRGGIGNTAKPDEARESFKMASQKYKDTKK